MALVVREYPLQYAVVGDKSGLRTPTSFLLFDNVRGHIHCDFCTTDCSNNMICEWKPREFPDRGFALCARQALADEPPPIVILHDHIPNRRVTERGTTMIDRHTEKRYQVIDARDGYFIKDRDGRIFQQRKQSTYWCNPTGEAARRIYWKTNDSIERIDALNGTSVSVELDGVVISHRRLQILVDRSFLRCHAASQFGSKHLDSAMRAGMPDAVERWCIEHQEHMMMEHGKPCYVDQLDIVVHSGTAFLYLPTICVTQSLRIHLDPGANLRLTLAHTAACTIMTHGIHIEPHDPSAIVREDIVLIKMPNPPAIRQVYS